MSGVVVAATGLLLAMAVCSSGRTLFQLILATFATDFILTSDFTVWGVPFPSFWGVPFPTWAGLGMPHTPAQGVLAFIATPLAASGATILLYLIFGVSTALVATLAWKQLVRVPVTGRVPRA